MFRKRSCIHDGRLLSPPTKSKSEINPGAMPQAILLRPFGAEDNSPEGAQQDSLGHRPRGLCPFVMDAAPATTMKEDVMPLVACPGCGTVLDRPAGTPQSRFGCFNCARRRMAESGLKAIVGPAGAGERRDLASLGASAPGVPVVEDDTPGADAPGLAATLRIQRSWLILGVLLVSAGLALAVLTFRPRHSKAPASNLYGDWQLAAVSVNGKQPNAAAGLAGAVALGAVWQFGQDGILRWPGTLPSLGIRDAIYSVSGDARSLRLRLAMKIKKPAQPTATEALADPASEGGEAETTPGRKPTLKDVSLEWQGTVKLTAEQLVICLAEPGVPDDKGEPGPGKLVLVYQRVRH